jgi:hypothetical protein
MPETQPNSTLKQDTGLTGDSRPIREPEPRSLVPWIIAGVAVLLVLGVLLLAGRHKAPPNPGGAGLAPPDPYAAQLTISHVQMSESANLSGGKLTYLDGQIANHGSQTLRGITVQVAFLNALKQIAQKETMPLNLIRTRQPYIDTEPMSAAPLAPGSTRQFRLIFDHVTDDWDQAYPEVRVIAVATK